MKYTKKQNAEIQRIVKSFNAKLARLEQQNISNLPEHVNVKELKKSFANQRDLNRRLSQLSAFSAKSAKQFVRVGKDKVKMSKWQKDIFLENRRLAKRRAKRDLEKTQRAIYEKSAQKAPIQSLKNETLKLRLDEYEFLTRDINKLTREQLQTSIATTNKVVEKFKRDKVFYETFFDMMFKDAQVAGLMDERVKSIKEKLSQLTPDQLYIAYEAEPMLKHFVEEYRTRDFSNINVEFDEMEIGKMNRNIDNLLEKADKIVNEFKEY